MKRFAFVPLVLAAMCPACDAPKGSFDATERAAASLSLDFSECVKSDFLQLAASGALSKEAAFQSAEKCGIQNIKDGLVLLVAAFSDVKNYLIAKHSTGKAQEIDAGADASPMQ